MFCPKCGTEYEGNYCPKCGTKRSSFEQGNFKAPEGKTGSPIGIVIAIVVAIVLILVIVIGFIFGIIMKSNTVPEEPLETNTESVEITEKQSEDTKVSEAGTGFSFSDLKMYNFTFASGAGGWSTEMHINDDGSFYGNYHDSNMGETGAGYPNGTLYYCDFTGKFTAPEKINDYSYRFKIEKLDFARTSGEEEIIDGVKYIYTEAYGLDEAQNLIMYIPGTFVSKLSEELLSWIFIGESSDNYSVIPFYALYNEAPGYGFFSNWAPEYIADPGDTDNYIIWDSDSRYLTESDLMGLDKYQLRLARNEIYARHGRIFEDEALQEYFEDKSWYSPLYDKEHFSDNVLNVYEKANALFIKEHEK